MGFEWIILFVVSGAFIAGIVVGWKLRTNQIRSVMEVVNSNGNRWDNKRR